MRKRKRECSDTALWLTTAVDLAPTALAYIIVIVTRRCCGWSELPRVVLAL
jgi:hypothetical protein